MGVWRMLTAWITRRGALQLPEATPVPEIGKEVEIFAADLNQSRKRVVQVNERVRSLEIEARVIDRKTKPA